MQQRIISAIILGAYILLLVKFLILKDVSFMIGHIRLNFNGQATGDANFVPFKTIIPYLLGESGGMIALFNLIGNIALFVPLGFLVPFIYRSMTWHKTIVLAVFAPLLIELIQVLLRVGIFDIDDVILNGLGVMLGYAFYRLLKRCMRT